MYKTPVPSESSNGQLSYQNFIQMVPLKETNSSTHPKPETQIKNIQIQSQKQHPSKPSQESLKNSQFQGQAYLQVLTKPSQTKNYTHFNVQTQTTPIPLQISQPSKSQAQTQTVNASMQKQFLVSPGKQCQQCKCILPPQILKMKQQIIKLQNQLLQQKDQNSRLRHNKIQDSEVKIKQLQEYIDKLHDQTSIKLLLQQLDQLKDKQNNSVICITQLSQENQRLQRECQKLVHKYTDLKQKSKYLTQNQNHSESRSKAGLSRASSRWRLDSELSEFEDYSHIVKSTSYINQLEESNTWLKKENKRLTDIIAQGLRCR